jgi:carbohydrate kinase (thermoresistant glucokinase family)
VYCFVRASAESNARIRVVKSLRERSVYHVLPVEARRKIVAVPADFNKASLGLEPDLYNQIASEISGLIHCAWSVNFNLGLTSFEADCIAGTHNLIMLCLQAQRPEPATFNFCSSVSAVAHTKGGFVPEALPESLEFAQNMGYAQSKVVAENICVAAARSCGISCRVLRVGQVVADTIHGIWNSTEAIPLMMQAGLTMGAIPKLDESPLWLPVDVVASAVAEVTLSNAGATVVNIVNHQSFHWTRDLLPALHRAGLEFSEPSQRDWVDRLRKSNPDPIANPPIKLAEFFASKYDNDLPREGLVYDTSYARFLSPSLATAPVLNQELVNKFVRKFQATSWTTPVAKLKKKLIVIAGPCGAGKSTVAEAISKEYNVPWIEGDSLHSKESIGKMSAGTPLSESDRWLWLETVKAHALLRLSQEQHNAIVVTCSALKHVYREELRRSRVLETEFILLQGTESIFKHRVQERKDHYIGAEMVNSQLDCLEAPGITETDIIPIDATLAREHVITEVLSVFKGFGFETRVCT